MRCSQAILDLADYADGKLGWWKSRKIRIHVGRCESCAQRLRGVEILQRGIREALQDRGDAPDVTAAVTKFLPLLGIQPARCRARKYAAVLSLAAAGAVALTVFVQLHATRVALRPAHHAARFIKGAHTVREDMARQQSAPSTRSDTMKRGPATREGQHDACLSILTKRPELRRPRILHRLRLRRTRLAGVAHTETAETARIVILTGDRPGLAMARRTRIVPAPPTEGAESIVRPPLQVVPACQTAGREKMTGGSA